MNKSDALGSVSIQEKSGAGLPYAPIDWPNPGDIWTWKLGKRISTDGFYRDRYIFPPLWLQEKAKKKLYFDSKKSITNYLQSEFPETDVDAFFNSFTWKVPVSMISSQERNVPVSMSKSREKVDNRGAPSSVELQNLTQVTPRPKKVHPRPKSERTGETEFTGRRSWRLIMSKSASKKRILFSSKEVKDIIDLSSCSDGTGSCKSTTDNSKSATDSENTQVSSSQNTGSPAQSSKDSTPCQSSKELQSETIPNDSDMLIDSADDSLCQSLPKSSDVAPVTDQAATTQEKMSEARNKLLLLLAKDNPVMRSSIKLSEIKHLWSLLKTDPNLDADQHKILKLIDEIPLAWKEFQENEKIAEEADKFSEDLETNIAWAGTLENEYNESKGYKYILQKEFDSISQKIKKVDEQISELQSQRISELQSQRDELASAAETKKKEMDGLISKQKKAADCLSKVVVEVEMGKKRKQQWELKKKMSEEQKAKILSKFDPLRDFSL